MSAPTEASSHIKADALGKDAGLDLSDGSSAPLEHTLSDSTRSHQLFCDSCVRSTAALGAERTSINSVET